MTEIIGAVIIVAIIYVLVKPGSKAPQAVVTISKAFASLISSAIGPR